ncbi:MAG: hypothetical protein LQ337_006978 [Flavoplaca oasis]|nr:MAG: hypothetical protein LQ337_006978 [Flavoplaca oasis]
MAGTRTPQDAMRGETNAHDVKNPDAELRKLCPKNGLSMTVTDVFATPVFSDPAAAMRSAASSTSSEGQNLIPKAPSSTVISDALKTCLRAYGFTTENVVTVAGATDMQADKVAVSELDGKGFKAIWTKDFQAPGPEVGSITRACQRAIREHALLRQCSFSMRLLFYKLWSTLSPGASCKSTSTRKQQQQKKKEQPKTMLDRTLYLQTEYLNFVYRSRNQDAASCVSRPTTPSTTTSHY